MKPSLRMLMIEAGIKRLIPQIVSVGKRKLPECPFLAQVQRLGDSKYQGEGVHTELYFSQKQPRTISDFGSSYKYNVGLKMVQKRSMSTIPIRRFLSAEDLARAKARKANRIEAQVESSKERLMTKARQRKVPATRFERATTFGTAGVGLGLNFVKNKIVSKPAEDPLLRNIGLTENDVQSLVDLLCQVRGAALKLGQMISIQDENFISPQLAAIFDRVRQTADYMPKKQLVEQLDKHLPGWEEKFAELDLEPFAAASIGQVHRGVTHDGETVAVKIQYPGVADSINSDIDNLVMLLSPFQARLPKQLFLDNVIDFARRELAWECDYDRELTACQRMKEFLQDDENFYVPKVYPELSSTRILTSEFVSGVPIDQLDVDSLSQDERNFLGKHVLKLCIKEIFQFQFMQTDPNFANFLYEPGSFKINLIDMGACRDYRSEFVKPYMELVAGAVRNDRHAVLMKSRELGFLTGHETSKMETAHVNSVITVGQPYQEKPFDFNKNNMAAEIADELPAMFEGRLTPPPRETYSLHRKLSGAFLMCSKVKAITTIRTDFIETLQNIGAHDLAQSIIDLNVENYETEL